MITAKTNSHGDDVENSDKESYVLFVALLDSNIRVHDIADE